MRYSIASPRKLIAAEIIAGIAGTLVISIMVTFASSMIKNTQNSILNVILAIISWSVIISVTSFLVYIVGKYNYKHGSYLFALLGSALGFGVCLLTTYLISVFRVFG
jgi:hypothetical protein